MRNIDVDKLIAELKRLKKDNGKEGRPSNVAEILYSHILSFFASIQFIPSLQQEQPEVDFEKELEQWRHKHFKGKRDGDYNGEYLERESQLDIARHFYELGRNAREEEQK